MTVASAPVADFASATWNFTFVRGKLFFYRNFARITHTIKYWTIKMCFASFTGTYTSNEIGAIFNSLLRVKGT